MLNILTGAYASFIKFGLIAAVVAALYGGYRYQLSESYKKGAETTKIAYEAKIIANNEVLQLKKKSAEKNLEIDFAKRQGEANEKIRNLNTTVSNLIAGLSDRKSRTESTSVNTVTRAETSPTGAYPSQLYREDAASFVNFARDAEEIRLGLLQCYADFDAAKKSIELFTEKK
jgi:archaellum component FlaG (FlaF/FlaG flagellin family)